MEKTIKVIDEMIENLEHLAVSNHEFWCYGTTYNVAKIIESSSKKAYELQAKIEVLKTLKEKLK